MRRAKMAHPSSRATYMPGRLFTEYFLTEGITTTDRWLASDAALSEFRDAAADAYEKLEGYDRPNEALTEQELILPVLELLGWADHLPQQGASRSEDIPDNLLFADTESKDRAAALPSTERYRQAAVVQESKRFDLPLDASGNDARAEAPEGQHALRNARRLRRRRRGLWKRGA